MENDLLLSPISLQELVASIRAGLKEDIIAAMGAPAEKLLCPADACKLFSPHISRVTLRKWTDDGLLQSQKIGGRVYYRQSEIVEAGSRLKKYKAGR